VKAGQLKLNGRLVERSALTDLQEREGLGAVVRGATAAWTALEVAQVASVEGVRERIGALTAISARLEPLQSASATRALGQVR
jgi:hypothetical protein